MKSTIRNLIEARRTDKDDEGGFTLIELLIVIVVLGILAAIVVFAVQNLTKESAAASCSADAKTTETALEAHRAKLFAYPNVPAAGFNIITATDFPTLVGVNNFVRSAPNATRYQIGLKPSGAPGTASDGKIYVRSIAAGAVEAEYTGPAVCTAAT